MVKHIFFPWWLQKYHLLCVLWELELLVLMVPKICGPIYICEWAHARSRDFWVFRSAAVCNETAFLIASSLSQRSHFGCSRQKCARELREKNGGERERRVLFKRKYRAVTHRRRRRRRSVCRGEKSIWEADEVESIGARRKKSTRGVILIFYSRVCTAGKWR